MALQANLFILVEVHVSYLHKILICCLHLGCASTFYYSLRCLETETCLFQISRSSSLNGQVLSNYYLFFKFFFYMNGRELALLGSN